MIYRVVLDDTIDLHTSDINCMLLNPSLDLEMNSAGSFNFTLPPSHPYWDAIKVLKSTIDVYEDGDLIFTGRIASIEKNWNNERVVQCEGALAYFNDSIHRQMKWETPLPIASEDPTVHNFLKDILDNHNVFEGAENANRHIFIGNITVDPEVVTREVNYDTTLDILTRMCIDTNGGYMSVRKNLDDGKLYLDWIKDFTEESGQPAQFGLNLLNFDTSLAAEDICTGVLARGAEVNEQTVMLNDVELVDETTYPDMSVTHYTTQYQDILWHREGVEKFGQVVQVHDFSDAQTAWKDGQGQIVANSLFEMAKKWLEEKNTKIETIEVEVAELAWLGEGMPKYKLGQIVELSDNVHMAGESYETRLLPMYKLSCDLNSGSKKVTLGTPPKKELTQISASNSDSSTLSSSGSSSGGGGGSGEGEECRVHDVKVNGTSVVTDKIANVQVPTDTVTATQMAQAINTAVSPKANTADVNQALAQKQDNLVFNSQDAATAHLTKIKNGNDVYDIPTGTEVEANPTGTATSDLTKLKVGNDIYGIPSGGTTVVANPSETATDDLNTIKIGNTVYDIHGGGSSTNYGKFKCDVLFDTPTSTSSWNSPIEICSEEKVKEYDMLHILSYTYTNMPMAETILVDDIGQSSDSFWLASPRTDSNITNVQGLIFLSFTNSKLCFYTGTGNTTTLCKVYGLKFENKLINRSDIYSEEERMIGRWTDGKPLYQKTVVIDNPVSTGATTSIVHGIADVETIVDIYGGAYLGSTCIDLNSFGSSNYYTLIYASQTNISYELKWGSSTFTKILATIQYTKTTDSPGSGVIPEDPQMVMMSDYYSEEEQVVGRWTDGKPLYQRTWDLGSNVEISNSTLTQTTISASNMETIVDAFGIYSTGVTRYNFMANIGDGYIKLQTDRNNSIASVRYVILRYTKTTDAPGSGPTKGNLIYLPALYSEEEREVGVWTDGKPIYQKTINTGALPNATTKTIAHGISNIETICNIFGYAYNGDVTFSLPLSYNYDNINLNTRLNANNTNIYLTNNRDRTNFIESKVTLQYTKTTDQPGSGTWTPEGQLAHHYSTSEKIVGTWIDGSTVYERTWEFASQISLESNSWYSTNISSSGFGKIIRTDGMDSNGTNFPIGAANSDGIIKLISFRNGTTGIKWLTLQYTKSS